ncbi:multicopper oxidase family protein [Anaeromyxobacter dehalogenans]|uniref:multicopper oxidase family protein n=1 Tax=Anaeromyxobacter dehalogenans TaxID=161493 RepID=UPI001FE2345E|nr:multicopper oxidase family protein [Anaeromyxobacter dehalogenans]
MTDPPVSGPLRALPVATPVSGSPGGMLHYRLEACQAPVAIDGASANAMVYRDLGAPLDGRFVAPVLRAEPGPGQRIRLEFTNGLPADPALNLLGHERHPTNVHVHGLHVSPGADAMTGLPADDVHLRIEGGGQGLTYDYDLAMQRPGSIALYHPHLHGSVAEQMWNGLVGAIDVSDGEITALDPYPATLLVLKDVTVSNGAPAPYTMLSEYMRGREGNVVTVNGQVNPYLAVTAGEVRRLRILNVSNARFYRLSLQGHPFHVVGADGGLLDRPTAARSELLMAPGERVDLLVPFGTADKGDYKLLALPYARHGNMASAQVTLLTVRIASRTRAAQALPAAVAPGTTRLSDDPALARPRFALSMGQGRGYINGITFEQLADGSIRSCEHHSMVGDDEIWEVVNESGMDHPWHQHVNDAQVLSISGGDASIARYAALYTSAPAWKDTIIIPKWGSATFRMPIRDHGGMTMFHCHILEHEDIGMMGMWHLMDDGMGGM